MAKVTAGQCGRNSAGRRFCVLPEIGSRLVAEDFDHEYEGFEVIEPPEQPEQPGMVPAADDGGEFESKLASLIRREVRQAVADQFDGVEFDEDDDLEDDDIEDDDDDIDGPGGG